MIVSNKGLRKGPGVMIVCRRLLDEHEEPTPCNRNNFNHGSCRHSFSFTPVVTGINNERVVLIFKFIFDAKLANLLLKFKVKHALAIFCLRLKLLHILF